MVSRKRSEKTKSLAGRGTCRRRIGRPWPRGTSRRRRGRGRGAGPTEEAGAGDWRRRRKRRAGTRRLGEKKGGVEGKKKKRSVSANRVETLRKRFFSLLFSLAPARGFVVFLFFSHQRGPRDTLIPRECRRKAPRGALSAAAVGVRDGSTTVACQFHRRRRRCSSPSCSSCCCCCCCSQLLLRPVPRAAAPRPRAKGA